MIILLPNFDSNVVVIFFNISYSFGSIRSPRDELRGKNRHPRKGASAGQISPSLAHHPNGGVHQGGHAGPGDLGDRLDGGGRLSVCAGPGASRCLRRRPVSAQLRHRLMVLWGRLEPVRLRHLRHHRGAGNHSRMSSARAEGAADAAAEPHGPAHAPGGQGAAKCPPRHKDHRRSAVDLSIILRFVDQTICRSRSHSL